MVFQRFSKKLGLIFCFAAYEPSVFLVWCDWDVSRFIMRHFIFNIFQLWRLVSKRMKVLLAIVLGIISVAYPILVYFGIQHVSPAVFSLVLLGLALARFFIAKDRLDVSQLGLLLLVVPFSLGLLITNSEYLLKLYPAVVSLGMSILFGASLWQDESFIERMARLGGKEITPRAKRYTRRLTLLWAFLLLFNVVVVL